MTERQKRHEHKTNERQPSAEAFVNATEHHESTQSLKEAEKQHRSRQLEHEALAKASELAKEADETKNSEGYAAKPTERYRGAPSKKQLQKSFDSEMEHVRHEMSTTDRMMSKVIHSRSIEKTSEILGSTLLRPNSMLTGSIAAFICITVVYFVARHYGYRLSGFETIAAFAIGWVIGLIYDYFAGIIRNRKP